MLPTANRQESGDGFVWYTTGETGRDEIHWSPLGMEMVISGP